MAPKKRTGAEPDTTMRPELITDQAMQKMVAEAEAQAEYNELIKGRQGIIEEHNTALRHLLLEGGGGAEAVESGMILTSTAGRVTVYNKETGRAVEVNYDQLAARLKLVFEPNHPMAGQRVYQRDPLKPKQRGSLLCPLHEDHEERSHWDGYGFPSCNKSNLINQLQVDRHVRFKHPTLHEVKAKERQDNDRAMQLEFFRAQAEALKVIAAK